MWAESRRKIAPARAAAGKPHDPIEMRANILLRTTGMRDRDKRFNQFPFLIGKFITTDFHACHFFLPLVLPLICVFFLYVLLFLTFQIHPSYYTYQKYGLTHSALDITKPYHWSDSAVANLLENEIYLGNTVNYRFSTKSYKDKRKMEHPREECLVFENTHPAIVSKEVWDIVQRVRKNKRRRTKMDEQNKYSGLVICADCGKAMVLHRAHTMSADYNHFTCRTYKKDGEACTAHYIRECILDEIVLEDLRRITAEAREHPQEFAEYLNSKQSAELQKEIRRLEKERAAMQKRKAELDAIFKKLYEDSVLGRITAEQFQMLSASYTDEQAKLTELLPQREAEIQRLKETASNTAAFLDKAKRYTDIQELTPELLRIFIQKIVVHEKEVKWSKHAPQTVEIHYADIGCMENMQTAEPEQDTKIPLVS